MNILMAGATGQVGMHLKNFFLEDEGIDMLFCLSRAAIPAHPGLQTEIIDFNQPDSWPLLPVDVAFCCLGTTMKKAGSKEAFYRVDHDYVLHFARYAKQAGCKAFHVVSALGANAASSVFYNQVKGKTEEDLRLLGFRSLFIYRPSLLISDRKEHRFWERLAIQVMRVINPLLTGKAGKYRSIHVKQVAAGMHSRLNADQEGVYVIDSDKI